MSELFAWEAEGVVRVVDGAPKPLSTVHSKLKGMPPVTKPTAEIY